MMLFIFFNEPCQPVTVVRAQELNGAETEGVSMPSPDSFAAFIVVNAIVWPTFSMTYYYIFQRRDENLIDTMESRSEVAAGEAEG